MNSSRSDRNNALRTLDAEIEKWSVAVAQLKEDNNERRIIEAKLAAWKQKREQLAALFVAELRHDLKTGGSR